MYWVQICCKVLCLYVSKSVFNGEGWELTLSKIIEKHKATPKENSFFLRHMTSGM